MHPKAHGPVLAWCFGGCVVFAVVVGPSGLGCVGRLLVVVAGLLSAAVVVPMAAVVALLRWVSVTASKLGLVVVAS